MVKFLHSWKLFYWLWMFGAPPPPPHTHCLRAKAVWRSTNQDHRVVFCHLMYGYVPPGSTVPDISSTIPQIVWFQYLGSPSPCQDYWSLCHLIPRSQPKRPGVAIKPPGRNHYISVFIFFFFLPPLPMRPGLDSGCPVTWILLCTFPTGPQLQWTEISLWCCKARDFCLHLLWHIAYPD